MVKGLYERLSEIFKYVRGIFLEVFQLGRKRVDNNDGQRNGHNVLLKRDVSVDAYENIEVIGCSFEEFAVGDAFPPDLDNRRYRMSW